VLPLNVINEKIYIVMWFWFFFLALTTIFALIWRILICLMPNLRLNVIRLRNRVVELQYLEMVNEKCEIGDWFLLNQLAKNIEPLTFKEIIYNLANNLGMRPEIECEKGLKNGCHKDENTSESSA
jgi:hypothetical protein